MMNFYGLGSTLQCYICGSNLTGADAVTHETANHDMHRECARKYALENGNTCKCKQPINIHSLQSTQEIVLARLKCLAKDIVRIALSIILAPGAIMGAVGGATTGTLVGIVIAVGTLLKTKIELAALRVFGVRADQKLQLNELGRSAVDLGSIIAKSAAEGIKVGTVCGVFGEIAILGASVLGPAGVKIGTALGGDIGMEIGRFIACVTAAGGTTALMAKVWILTDN